MENKVSLFTPNGSQTIYFSDDQNIKVIDLVEGYDKIILVIDSRISEYEHSLKVINKLLESNKPVHIEYITINNYTKNTQLMLLLLDAFARVGMTRNSIAIAIGGGATCDLVGVTSSVYMRGIPYATIPTSYISMVDGVISKVAINHGLNKNLVGAFNSPDWTYIDTKYVMNHMDRRRILHGLVEAWKHAIIECDGEKQQLINNIASKDVYDFEELINLAKWSMNIKAKYVLDDWRDSSGKQKQLSLGHTLANYLEMVSQTHHAEAVCYGILFESIISKELGRISAIKLNKIFEMFNIFENEFMNINNIKPLVSSLSLSGYLEKDKINAYNKITFVIPTDQGSEVEDITKEDLANAISSFTSYENHIPMNI